MKIYSHMPYLKIKQNSVLLFDAKEAPVASTLTQKTYFGPESYL